MHRGFGRGGVAVMAAGLVACSGGSTSTDPARPSPLSPAASPAASLPALSDAELKASAEQFVRDYYAAVNAAIKSGDGKRLGEFSVDTCACRDLLTLFERMHAEDRRFEPYEFAISAVSATLAESRTAAEVDASYDLPVQKVIDVRGKVVASIPEERNTLVTFTLIRVADRWKIRSAIAVRAGA